MLLIHCPYCRMARPELEFRYAGEAHVTRPADPMSTTDEAWAEYLYMRSNPKGVHAERWRHTYGCGQWFNALRDTQNHTVHAVWRMTEPMPEMKPEVPR